MDILGVDFGDVRVGLARIDSDVMIAQPLKTVPNNETLIDSIKKEIAEYDSQIVVVGLPLNLSGEETEQTRKTEKFFDTLTEAIDQKVVFFEESGTSKLADERLRSGWGGKLADRDSVSAAIILEGFIKEIGV